MSAIVAALSWGAVQLTSGALSEAGKEAYSALKVAVVRFVSPSDVDQLENFPGSENRKGVVAEELQRAGRADDREIVSLAEALIAQLQHDGLVGGATGISLEEVEAVNIRLKQIKASGSGVDIKRVKASGDIDISDVSAGVPPLGKLDRR